MNRHLIAVVAAALGLIALAPSAQAGNIVDEWASVKAPQAPAGDGGSEDHRTSDA